MVLGGWQLIRTMGRGIFHIRSLDGLVSQGTSAGVMLCASLTGAPVSTTQVVTVVPCRGGGGPAPLAPRRLEVVRRIAIAWVTTPLAAGIISVFVLPLWRLVPGG